MKKKNILILDDEFIKYCELNGIEDIEKLARTTFNNGFTMLKWGDKIEDKIPIKKNDEDNKKEPIIPQKELTPIKSNDTSSLYDE